jgi:hypothetical protein
LWQLFDRAKGVLGICAFVDGDRSPRLIKGNE